MAAPFVTGSVALLLNKYPGASLDFIKNSLASGATDLGAAGWDPYYGYGRLNIARSLGFASSTTAASGEFSGSFSSSGSFTQDVSMTPPMPGFVAMDERFTRRRVEEELLFLTPAGTSAVAH
jgi:hypothetical protein